MKPFIEAMILLAMALAAACGDNKTCVPGEQISCPCVGASNGVQQCQEDGTTYGSCACGSINPDLAGVDLAGLDLAGSDLSGIAGPTIVVRSVSQGTTGTTSVMTLTVNAPAGMAPGDVLLATVYLGDSAATVLPTIASPAGWTLVDRIDEMTKGSLAIYWHLVGPGEPSSYTWTGNQKFLGVAWIAAYQGVDGLSPIDVHLGQAVATVGTSYSTPTLTTTQANTLVVASFTGYRSSATPPPVTSWSCPPQMTLLASLNNGASRSGCGATGLASTAGALPIYVATASQSQVYALMHLVALKPTP